MDGVLMHKKLTEVDRWSLGCTEIWQKLTDGLWPHEKFTDVGIGLGCKES